jgi:cation diffusion facilitator CzcD-associated flavoprotein CzcO
MAPIPAASHSEPDVLIVGAGPTGLTLAMALPARGMRTHRRRHAADTREPQRVCRSHEFPRRLTPGTVDHQPMTETCR